MGFPVSEAYSLPVNAKSLVGSVMVNLCLLRKILGTVPREQRDDLSEIWGEEHLSLEDEKTSDFERQNTIGNEQCPSTGEK